MLAHRLVLAASHLTVGKEFPAELADKSRACSTEKDQHSATEKIDKEATRSQIEAAKSMTIYLLAFQQRLLLPPFLLIQSQGKPVNTYSCPYQQAVREDRRDAAFFVSTRYEGDRKSQAQRE